jgi:seryl-tRNA synthetase
MSDAKIETMVMITGREYEALRAENERLNRSRNKWGQKYNELLKQHKVTVSQLKAAVWSDSEECKLLTAEVEKLRAALRDVISSGLLHGPTTLSDEVRGTVHAALGEK